MKENTYLVKKISPGEMIIDGKGTNTLWQQANVLEDFSYPWREETPPKTVFRALWDGDFLYLLYWAEDPDIFYKSEQMGEMDVVNSDRVEIFFKKDDEMNPYYALELDALGRILDTEGRYYREVDFEWNWPEGQLIVKANTEKEGYWVEVSVSMSSLEELGMWKKGQTYLNAGLYRGEYTVDQGMEPSVKWISWIKPDSPKPDFHIPSSFGVLNLEQ